MESRTPNDKDPQALLEAAGNPGGVAYEIASELIESDVTLESPAEVWEVILPRRGAVETPRWQLNEEAPGRLKELVAERSDEVMALADGLRLRLPDSFPEKDIEALRAANPEDILAAVEPGANETAAKRGQVLAQALEQAEVPLDVPMFFVATDEYKVPVLRADGTPNPEQAKARAVADDLPEGDLTQHQITCGTQVRLGYRVAQEFTVPDVGTFIEYQKEGERDRIVVKPAQIGSEGGTVAGLLAINHVYHALEDAQLVLGTNGQYREKLALQGQLAAIKAGSELAQDPIVFGDEAGLEVPHPDAEGNIVTFTTAARGEVAYIKEVAAAGKVRIEIEEARAA
ncbi:MAG TPA: hypothetical protein VK694_01915 [Verrucomicrobiae bacterium]|nr:hypothetical protein [Verrucomicrobiae bacterium]